MATFLNRRWWKLLALGSLLLAWAAPAFAGGTLNPAGGNAWELYVFGNGNVVWNILNSVSAMVGDPGYHDLLEFVGVLGIFGAAIVSGFDASKMPRMLAFVIGAFLVLYTSLNVTANIMVRDPVTNYTNVATGVPALVGIPAAVISDVGHWLTEKVEQDFSLPNDLTVSGGDGFNLANSLTQAATQAQILDPYLRNSFANYIQNCVIPELANGTMNADTLLNSTDMFAALQTNNQGVMTPYYSASNSNGTLVSCTTAYSDIKQQLQQDSQALLTANSDQWGGAGASIVSNELTSALAFLSNNTVNQPADQSILQAATINMFNSSALQQGAAMTGNNGMMISMALAQATQSQESSWYTGAQIFNSLMGYIYSVLQAFLFAVTPILFAALLIPGFGFAIMKNFAQVLLWLILWQPMLAIVNYIMSLYGQQAYGGIMASAGGLTDMNLPVISEQSAHMALAAGFLGTMVPMIAWGLVKGSLAFSDFIMSAGGGAFASQAAQQATSGNVTLDNQSMNNDSFNSKNFTHSLAVGENAMDVTRGLGAVNQNTDIGGTSMSDAAGAISGAFSSDTSAGTGTTGSSGTSTGTSYSSTEGKKAEIKSQQQSDLKRASTITNQFLSKQGENAANTIAEQATAKTLDQAAANFGNETTQQQADSIYSSLEAQANALGLAGSGLALLRGAGMDAAEGAAVKEALSKGEDAASVAAASGGKISEATAEKLVAQRAKNLGKLKNDKNLQGRIVGYLRATKKWAEKEYANPKVRDAVQGVALAAVAASMFVGVGEVAAAVGGAVELGEGAVAAGEAVEAGGAAADAAEGAAAEGADGAADGEAAAPKTDPKAKPGESESNSKPEEKDKGKKEKDKGKEKKNRGGLAQALEALGSKGSVGAKITNTNSETAKQGVQFTGSKSNDTTNSAGSSRTVTTGTERSLALQNTLQAIKGVTRSNSASLDLGLQLARKADQIESVNTTAEIKNSGSFRENMPVSLGEGSTENISLEYGAIQRETDNRSLNLGPSNAAQKMIAQDQERVNSQRLSQEVNSAVSPNQARQLQNLLNYTNPAASTGASTTMRNISQKLSARDQKLVGKIAGMVKDITSEYNNYSNQARLSSQQITQKVLGKLHSEGYQINKAELMPLMNDAVQEVFNRTPSDAPGTGAPYGSSDRGLLPGGGN